MANLKDLIVNGAARIIGKVYASEFVGNLAGNASTATKLGTSDVGGPTTPMYLSGGTPTAGTALAAVATSGSYTDLSNKPSIPSKVSQLTNDSGYLTRVYALGTEGDNRSTSTAPSNYSNIFKFAGLKGNHVINQPSSDTYSYLFGLRGWSDASGGNSWELAFNNSGIFARQGASTTWDSWKKLWLSGDAVTGAVWNDLIDCLDVPEDDILEPGYCYCMHEDGHYHKSEKYLDSRYIGIDSDTYSLAMGMEKDKRKLNAAVAGFVLAYVDKEYPVGTPLTCTENGILTEIKKEDKCYNPEMIIAKYWKNEEREEIVREDKTVKVNGRKWVKVI